MRRSVGSVGSFSRTFGLSSDRAGDAQQAPSCFERGAVRRTGRPATSTSWIRIETRSRLSPSPSLNAWLLSIRRTSWSSTQRSGRARSRSQSGARESAPSSQAISTEPSSSMRSTSAGTTPWFPTQVFGRDAQDVETREHATPTPPSSIGGRLSRSWRTRLSRRSGEKPTRNLGVLIYDLICSKTLPVRRLVVTSAAPSRSSCRRDVQVDNPCSTSGSAPAANILHPDFS